MMRQPDLRAAGLALTSRRGVVAYNEQAFRYFLALERRRSERTDRPFLLVLVDFRPPAPAPRMTIDHLTASKVFASLWLCLRDTDFVGWYRDGHIAGAVLPQQPASCAESSGTADLIHRIGRTLGRELPAATIASLHIRVCRARPRRRR